MKEQPPVQVKSQATLRGKLSSQGIKVTDDKTPETAVAQLLSLELAACSPARRCGPDLPESGLSRAGTWAGSQRLRRAHHFPKETPCTQPEWAHAASSARPPPALLPGCWLAHHTQSPRTAVHRCPAGCLDTECWRPQDHQHTAVSGRWSPDTQGRMRPRSTCSSWERALLETQQSPGLGNTPFRPAPRQQRCARGTQHRAAVSRQEGKSSLVPGLENPLGTPRPAVRVHLASAGTSPG